MKALLIVAGRSKRFWPLSEKSLFPLCGKTLLQHQVDCLAKAGIRDVTLVVGAHNKKEIALLFPKLTRIEQKDLELGMRGALLSALPKMGSDPFLLVSGNDVIDAKGFSDLLVAAKQKDVHGALLAQKVKRYFPGGYLTVKKGRVTGIVEKPGEGNEPSDLVNLVAHVHKDPKVLLKALKEVKTTRDDGYEAALQSLLETFEYRAVAYTSDWNAVKYPWHLLHLLPRFLGHIEKQQIHKTAVVHPSAVIEGNVILSEGVKVLPHATVKGPCFIGPRTVIANNALVRNSSIGADCVVGFGSEVKGSLLSNAVWTHMTYLGDSVIGENVSFGGGSTTGNLRFDEAEVLSKNVQGEGMLPTGLVKLGLIAGDGCRFGFRVGTNPGVKIGRGTFVAGGVVVTEDVPDQSFVYMKDGAVVAKPNKASAGSMEERERFRKEGKF